MIKLTKLNKEPFIINCGQIERIELIPESKIIMMNKDYYVVRESAEEIVQKIIDYNAKIYEWHQKISIEHNGEENLLW